jgi:hypothetical protein
MKLRCVSTLMALGAAELGAAGLLRKLIDFGLLGQEIDQRLERLP